MLKSYRFRIEGGFVEIEGLGGRCGFYTTIYARAGSARRALDQATRILQERMHKHGVIERPTAPFRTVYVVDDVSEVTAEAGIEYEGKDTGFTFFSITPFATIYQRVRYSLIRRFRPHLVFRIHGE